jgi:hypothetical protein
MVTEFLRTIPKSQLVINTTQIADNIIARIFIRPLSRTIQHIDHTASIVGRIT